MSEKLCTKCGMRKGLSLFNKKAASPDGHSSQCRACASVANRIYHAVHIAAAKERSAIHHLRRYGLSHASFDVMYAKQDGRCKICKAPINSSKQRRNGHTAVDHCHATGVVRGLLCMACNSGLGYFKENPDFLAEAIRYLAASYTADTLTPRK